MIYGILMLYVLRKIDAPSWCFIVDWFCIIISALGTIMKVWESEYKKRQSNKLIDKILNDAAKKVMEEEAEEAIMKARDKDKYKKGLDKDH